LLSHILGSNPSIAGYSELHRRYSWARDIFILRARVFLETGENLHKKYVLDKILHNPFSVSNNIFQKKNAFFIFLLRDPESTMQSIIEMGQKTNIIWQKEIDLILKYYVKRLTVMGEYARKNQNRFFYIDSDDLVNETERVLANISDWLGLNQQLSKEYKIFKNTGEPGHGDPSVNIRMGKVVLIEKKKNIAIPEQVLREAMVSYVSCRDYLKKNAINSDR